MVVFDEKSGTRYRGPQDTGVFQYYMTTVVMAGFVVLHRSQPGVVDVVHRGAADSRGDDGKRGTGGRDAGNMGGGI